MFCVVAGPHFCCERLSRVPPSLTFFAESSSKSLLLLLLPRVKMGKINGCLKCLFIFFNVIFEIIGCILIFAAVKSMGVSAQVSQFGAPSTSWTWVFAIGIFAISSLGIYAACSENVLVLKIFAGFMGTGMVIMLIFGIYVAVMKSKVHDLIQEGAKTLMNDKAFQDQMDAVQEYLQCCGILSADDWQGAIPDSCQCPDSYDLSSECKSKPVGSSGPDRIYKQPCANMVTYYIDLAFKIALGFFFGFAAIALMGLLISFLMIHQVKQYEGAGPAMAMKSY
uniref:Tetraspanin n=1 Tax=Oryzias latipes TaxID=8090 RepID=A0A3P9LU93_ORYLA